MSPILIIANILSFIGNLLFTLSSILKSKKKILLFQSTNHVLAIISEFMTNAYSGMVQEFTSLARNIVLLFVKREKKILKLIITIAFVIVAVVAGALINYFVSDNVWYGYLPIMGMFLYSVASTYVFVKEGLSKNKTELLLKVMLIVNGVCQCIYGIMVQLYPTTIFNSITIVLSIFSIVRISISVHKENQKKETEEEFEE